MFPAVRAEPWPLRKTLIDYHEGESHSKEIGKEHLLSQGHRERFIRSYVRGESIPPFTTPQGIWSSPAFPLEGVKQFLLPKSLNPPSPDTCFPFLTKLTT